jgi:phage baseplate assembly protein V
MFPIAQLLKSTSSSLYLGTVTAVNDAGQCQVSIPGVMVGTPETLPWLSVMTEPGAQKRISLPVTSQVIVTFPFAEFNHGIIMGTIQSEGTRPANITTKDQYGFSDEKGNHMTVDKAAQTVHMQTETGIIVDIDAEGSATITIPKKVTVNITDDFTLNCKNFNVTANENFNVTAGQNVAFTAGGNFTSSSVNAELAGSGVTNINAGSALNLEGGAQIAGNAPLYAWT